MHLNCSAPQCAVTDSRALWCVALQKMLQGIILAVAGHLNYRKWTLTASRKCPQAMMWTPKEAPPIYEGN